MEKDFQLKNYVNLYKFASIKLEEILKLKDTIIIYSNCASLIAGLSFNLIRLQNKNINIVMNDDIKIINNSVNLILNHQPVNEYDYYFEYIGNEDGVLLCSK